MDIRVGDNFQVGPFAATKTDGSRIDLTGALIEASVATDRGAAPLFTLQNAAAGGSDQEIAVTGLGTDAERIVCYVSTARSGTQSAATTYHMDVRVKTAAGGVYTVAETKWKTLAAFTPVPTP